MPKKFIIMEKNVLIIIIFINILKTKFIVLPNAIKPAIKAIVVGRDRIIGLVA